MTGSLRQLSALLGLSDFVLGQLQDFYGVADFNNWEAQDWPYYDTVFVPTAASAEIQFFSVPSGGADPNRPATTITKTDEQTNLQNSNQIGGAEAFVMLSAHLDLFPAPKARQQVAAVAAQTTFAADQLLAARWLQNMSAKGTLEIDVNKATWMQQAQPFRRFAPGFGLGDVKPPAIAGVTAPINGGANAYAAMSPFSVYDMGDIFTLDQPVFFAPSTPFTWKIRWPDGNSIASTSIYNGSGTSHDQTATFLAYAEMRGVKIRPVQ